MEEFIETLDLNNLLKCCRVCERPDEYMNLFYNINKELLRNFAVLVGADVNQVMPTSIREINFCYFLGEWKRRSLEVGV